jgi:hypothetical protein
MSGYVEMSIYDKIILIFLISFPLLILFTLKNDDDISTILLTRKPTQLEALRRLRYVLARGAAAASGGYIIALEIIKNVIVPYRLMVLPDQGDRRSLATIIILISCFTFLFILRVIQNVIRRRQGRSPRPWIDFRTLVHNFRKMK